jgi:hypothetical protein
MRTSVAVAIALCAPLGAPLAAQATRDRPTLIFTISAAYLDGVGLWTVPDQPVSDNTLDLVDHFFLSRSVKRNLGAGFSGTYYRGAHVGFTAEAFMLGLGYSDVCRPIRPAQSTSNADLCSSINDTRSAAAVTMSTGLVYRVGAGEFISPFGRLAAGILINNQSPLRVTGHPTDGSDLVLYDDARGGPWVRPAFTLGVGTTIAAGRGYHIRWEVRDNIVGIQRVTGVNPVQGGVPPHETTYKHILGLSVGLDVILEKRRGRRY